MKCPECGSTELLVNCNSLYTLTPDGLPDDLCSNPRESQPLDCAITSCTHCEWEGKYQDLDGQRVTRQAPRWAWECIDAALGAMSETLPEEKVELLQRAIDAMTEPS